MPDEDVHLHPSRPPTEAEHRFARGIVTFLQVILAFVFIAVGAAGAVGFAVGVSVLVVGESHPGSARDGLCAGWAVLVMGVTAILLLAYAVEWVKWASGTKPARREHDGDWRDFDA
jgi:hypothetical protein